MNNLKFALNIMATYGEEGYLEKSILSVLACLPITEVIIQLPADVNQNDFLTEELKAYLFKVKHKILSFTWVYDFAKARNNMLIHTSNDIDYVVWLDPDEQLNVAEKPTWERVIKVINETKKESYSLEMQMLAEDNKTISASFLKTKIIKPHLRFRFPIHEDIKFTSMPCVIKGANIYHSFDKADKGGSSLFRNVTLLKSNLQNSSLDEDEKLILKSYYLRDSYLYNSLLLKRAEEEFNNTLSENIKLYSGLDKIVKAQEDLLNKKLAKAKEENKEDVFINMRKDLFTKVQNFLDNNAQKEGGKFSYNLKTLNDLQNEKESKLDIIENFFLNIDLGKLPNGIQPSLTYLVNILAEETIQKAIQYKNYIDKAETFVRIALSLDVHKQSLYIHLGTIAELKELTEQAIEMYLKVINWNKNSVSFAVDSNYTFNVLYAAKRACNIYLNKKDYYKYLELSKLSLNYTKNTQELNNILVERNKIINLLQEENNKFLQKLYSSK